MFSKATLVGVVGVQPRYRQASKGKDSIIYFRIGCQVFTPTKEITEWYTIKAYGRVADYLYQNVEIGSNVFLEASIRTKRWVADGVERQGMEFHAFTARKISDSPLANRDDENSTQKAKTSPVSHAVSQELPFPEMEISHQPAVEEVKEPPKPMTVEQSRAIAKRFRDTFEESKQIAEERLAVRSLQPEGNINAENKTSCSNVISNCVSSSDLQKDTSQFELESQLPSSGNPLMDSLISARQSLVKSRATHAMSDYALIRG